MNFYPSEDVVQRVNGGRFNVPKSDEESSHTSRPQEVMAEYGLVQAVLREAIREYQKFAGQRGRRGSRLFREVHQWFLEDDGQWDFSFVNVCRILDLEPTYIRTGLKLWSDRNVKANPDLIGEKTSTGSGRPETLARTDTHAPRYFSKG
jgi:hypothetical protein